MKNRSKPAHHAPLFLGAAQHGSTPDAGFTADFQDLYGLAMDQAVGLEKASLAAVACLSSCAIDIYKNESWLSPALGKLFDEAFQALATCIELQLSCLALLTPHALSQASTEASHFVSQATPTPDELAHCMDIAMGERFTAPRREVATISGRQAQREAEEPECRELALAARAS
jgi:hypothetical protein